jgi:hypothetical protein
LRSSGNLHRDRAFERRRIRTCAKRRIGNFNDFR